MFSKKSDSTRKELGNKLKEARKKVGLTQAEVAEAEANNNDRDFFPKLRAVLLGAGFSIS